MSGDLQEGIYISKNPQIGNSLCVFFLRVSDNSSIDEIGELMRNLWNNFDRIKKGIISDLDVNPKRRTTGNLSVLVGYGASIFNMHNIRKPLPSGLSEGGILKYPDRFGGGAIVDGSQISYSSDVLKNHVLDDHIMFQIISDTEFHTNRAFIETWKEINRLNRLTYPRKPLSISGCYFGFQRLDSRSWLGFHDGLSNIERQYRKDAVVINTDNLKTQDKWLSNGTYAAFLRIIIDLESWEQIDIDKQELIIGRDKKSGCPLIGINKLGKPVKDPRCPVAGTLEVIDEGNKYFRESHRIGFGPLPPGVSNSILNKSHIGLHNPTTRYAQTKDITSRIFRQGFEFLEPQNGDSIEVGLNFMSFQNSPLNFLRSLTYLETKKTGTSDIERNLPRLDNFLKVRAGGIFVVPPRIRAEPFPGSSIFFGSANAVKKY